MKQLTLSDLPIKLRRYIDARLDAEMQREMYYNGKEFYFESDTEFREELLSCGAIDHGDEITITLYGM